ncbi:neuropeptide Y receptor type 4-2-like [Ascaphus truei]|uniref:neuropeptide Y receptor type 4-2-like n=1 Tax=Ascaphus truei TaxID=8439 RepID=UPI003F5AD4EA
MNESLLSETPPDPLFFQNASLAFLAGFQNKCRHSPDLTPFLGTSYSLVTMLGLLGNLSLIYVIFRHREKGNVTHVLIANLAFSDMLVCAFCLPFSVVYTVMDYWVFGLGLCKVTNFVQCASVTVSVLVLVLIAFERHQLILHPTGWKPNVPQAYAAVLLAWGLASLLALPLVSSMVLTDAPHKNISKVLGFFADKSACVESWPSAQQRAAYTISLLLLQYCVPLCFIVGCYLHIYVHLRRRGALFGRKDVHMKRVNLMLASMVGAFAVCWLPLNVFNSIVDWDHQLISVCYHNLIFSLCHLLAMTSTCVNPVIYGLLNSNVKREVKALLRSCAGRREAETLDVPERRPLSSMQSASWRGPRVVTGPEEHGGAAQACSSL